MKNKRKPRTKAINEVDLLKPLLGDDLYKLGSAKDPCFAKLYDPKAEECRRCGDCEVCAIAFGQALHGKREKVEKDNNFLDIEEEAIDKLTPKQKAKKFIRRLINMNKSITIQNLKTQVLAGTGISEKEFEKVLGKVLETTEKFEKVGNQIKLK